MLQSGGLLHIEQSEEMPWPSANPFYRIDVGSCHCLHIFLILSDHHMTAASFQQIQLSHLYILFTKNLHPIR